VAGQAQLRFGME